ncbi:MAG TPA: hypothetical protein VLD66_08810 [Methyloceanibacter sp.]|nr:hypothetical protein [Methyloceanibacter sp.]
MLILFKDMDGIACARLGPESLAFAANRTARRPAAAFPACGVVCLA